jgi:hypothetical protein
MVWQGHHQPEHEKVAGKLAEWSARPLDPIYPVIFVDALGANGSASCT